MFICITQVDAKLFISDTAFCDITLVVDVPVV